MSAFRIPAESGDVKRRIAIQKLAQLLRHPGALAYPLLVRKRSETQVLGGLCKIFRVAKLEERNYGALRRVAMERVLRVGNWLDGGD